MYKVKYKILLAEDDLNLGVLLVDLLQDEGFFVKLCRDGEQALFSFGEQHFDLCILDVMLPKRDGFALAEAFRLKDQKIPLIFLTAKALKADKLKGYGLGADDYIAKPFDEEELLWKIRALLRRLPDNSIQDQGPIMIGRYTFDFTNQLLSINSKKQRITEKECEILKYLSARRNNLVKREDLLKELWGNNDYFLGRSLDVFITKLRKYLKEDPDINVENVFGVGFILNVTPEKIK